MVRVSDRTIKIFASFSGGYTQGDSWKLNSGVTKIIEKNNLYNIYGYSGSVYIVHKKGEWLLSSYNRSVLDGMLEDAEKVVPGQVYCISMEDVLSSLANYEIEYTKEE